VLRFSDELPASVRFLSTFSVFFFFSRLGSSLVIVILFLSFPLFIVRSLLSCLGGESSKDNRHGAASSSELLLRIDARPCTFKCASGGHFFFFRPSSFLFPGGPGPLFAQRSPALVIFRFQRRYSLLACLRSVAGPRLASVFRLHSVPPRSPPLPNLPSKG